MKLTLTQEEAVVLRELVHRLSGQEDYLEDAAELYVLWELEEQLEQQLIGPYQKSDTQLLRTSRDAVRKKAQSPV